MTNLASSASRVNSGHVEGTYFEDPFGLTQPEYLVRPNLSDGYATIPWLFLRLGWQSKKAQEVYRSPKADLIPLAMLRQGASRKVQEVFQFLHHLCHKHGHRYCFIRTRSFLPAIGIKEATARKAIAWLVRHGWIVRVDDQVDGQERIVLWCLWLLPDTGDGLEFEFGHGTGVRLRCSDQDGDQLVKPPGRVRRAVSGAGCAPKGAPRSARKQNSPEGILREESSNANAGCVAELHLAGDSEPETTVTTAATTLPPEPPGLPAFSPEEVAERIATIDAGPVPGVHPGLALASVVQAYRELAWRDLVPPDRAAEWLAKFKDPGQPDRPRVRYVPPPAPVSTVEVLMRLADQTGPGAIRAAVERLARDFGAKDGKPFQRNVERIAAGEIPVDGATDAYRQAMKPGDKPPGLIWNGMVKKLVQEQRP